MRSLMTVLIFTAMTFLCWGLYGPVLHEGQYGLGLPGQPSSLRPLICVGLAYFAIAVVVPLVLLNTRGEQGYWTLSGALWSLMAGAAGAVGALGITLAFKFGGRPIFVMPLVFGLAPVVNTFVTMWMTKTFRQANPIFFSGVIIVAIGAAGVMFFKPVKTHTAVPPAPVTSAADEESSQAGSPQGGEVAGGGQDGGIFSSLAPLALVPLWIGLTACCWGSYGSVLHKGQMKMGGSRLRAFLCVGLAYFVIAVLAPLPLLNVFQEPGGWTISGVIWSLGGGVAGALGALGIVMAFNFGGKPIYVMPLVFGGAPVVNTFTTILHEGTYQETTAMFFASLMLVIGGAITVLVFAPRGKPREDSGGQKPPSAEAGQPKTDRQVETLPERHLDLDAGPGSTDRRVDLHDAEVDDEDTIGEDDTMGHDDTVGHKDRWSRDDNRSQKNVRDL